MSDRKPPASGGGPPKYAYVPTPQKQQQQQSKGRRKREAAPTTKNNGNTSASSDGIYESSISPQVGGVYAPLLRVQYKRNMENATTVPLPPKVIGGLRDQAERLKICNCKKSNCLKVISDYSIMYYCAVLAVLCKDAQTDPLFSHS